ncbi:MAG: hypothetical protein R2754_13155 [Microthrixaceae bacterium]
MTAPRPDSAPLEPRADDEFFSPERPTPPEGTRVVDLRASHPPEFERSDDTAAVPVVELPHPAAGWGAPVQPVDLTTPPTGELDAVVIDEAPTGQLDAVVIDEAPTGQLDAVVIDETAPTGQLDAVVIDDTTPASQADDPGEAPAATTPPPTTRPRRRLFGRRRRAQAPPAQAVEAQAVEAPTQDQPEELIEELEAAPGAASADFNQRATGSDPNLDTGDDRDREAPPGPSTGRRRPRRNVILPDEHGSGVAGWSATVPERHSTPGPEPEPEPGGRDDLGKLEMPFEAPDRIEPSNSSDVAPTSSGSPATDIPEPAVPGPGPFGWRNHQPAPEAPEPPDDNDLQHSVSLFDAPPPPPTIVAPEQDLAPGWVSNDPPDEEPHGDIELTLEEASGMFGGTDAASRPETPGVDPSLLDDATAAGLSAILAEGIHFGPPQAANPPDLGDADEAEPEDQAEVGPNAGPLATDDTLRSPVADAPPVTTEADDTLQADLFDDVGKPQADDVVGPVTPERQREAADADPEDTDGHGTDSEEVDPHEGGPEPDFVSLDDLPDELPADEHEAQPAPDDDVDSLASEHQPAADADLSAQDEAPPTEQQPALVLTDEADTHEPDPEESDVGETGADATDPHEAALEAQQPTELATEALPVVADVTTAAEDELGPLAPEGRVPEPAMPEGSPEPDFVSLDDLLAELPGDEPAVPEATAVTTTDEELGDTGNATEGAGSSSGASNEADGGPAEPIVDLTGTPGAEVAVPIDPVPTVSTESVGDADESPEDADLARHPATPVIVDLAEVPEEPGLELDALLPQLALAVGAAGLAPASGGDWGRHHDAPHWSPPTGPRLPGDPAPDDLFSDLADAGDHPDERIDDHDWWEFSDADQAKDDRGGFRAAASATEAVDLTDTEMINLGTSDLAVPPTATKHGDLEGLEGADSDRYEAALQAFFDDAPAERNDAESARAGTDGADAGDLDLASDGIEEALAPTGAVATEPPSGTRPVEDDLDDVDRWVEDTFDTHGDWLELSKKSTAANLTGILVGLLVIVGMVLATIWVVANL